MLYVILLAAATLLLGGDASVLQKNPPAGEIVGPIQQDAASQPLVARAESKLWHEMAPTDYDCAPQTDIPESECLALVALFNATGGSSWTNKDGWLVNDPVGWFGVTIDLSHVREIVLPNNGLIGPIPIEIGNLSELEILHLEDNDLSGAIPAQLGSLTKVTSLYLDKNQLSGSIPASFGGLASLVDLHLQYNLLDGPIPDELGDIQGMHHLLLYANQLDGSIPTALGGLANLTYLRLDQNQLVGPIPPSLGSLTAIDRLNLSNNQLSGAVPFKAAEVGASATNCNLTGNATLCMPNLLDYQALGDPLCGLPLEDTCILLPLEISMFEAVVMQDGIRVVWETESESQASGFELQYNHPLASGGDNAAAGLLWESVAFIEATGSPASGGKYSYHLPLPNAFGTGLGTHQFRLRMVDLDGSFTYSPAIEVVGESAHSLFLGPARPNPFTSQTRLHFSGHVVRPVKVSLFDVAGRLVEVLYEGIPDGGRMHELRIDASGLSSGIYIVQLNGSGFVESRKIVLTE